MLTPQRGYSFRHAFSEPSQHVDTSAREASKKQHIGKQIKAPLIEGGALKGRGEYRESVDYKLPGAGSTAALCVAHP
jgi:hypothetical protein